MTPRAASDDDVPGGPAADLAETARAQRLRLGLRVGDVAARAGLSVGLVSQLERGQGNPALSTLRSLADALGMGVTDLLEPRRESQSALVRAGEGRRLRTPDESPGLERELLTPSLDAPLQVIRTVVPVGLTNESRPYRHLGTEAVHVLSGELDVTVDGRTSRLRAGDTLTYDCSTGHWWANPGPDEAVVLGVTVPLSR
ncbi:helix-turn-helix domain-containing protein [Georgenia sp. Z1344]|uniref:helix-turn-helix domain-containing protein n=1 Tax=Georgenia sp. Z1344 TaxID=3416706 RepID=UPI003CE7A9E1